MSSETRAQTVPPEAEDRLVRLALWRHLLAAAQEDDWVERREAAAEVRHLVGDGSVEVVEDKRLDNRVKTCTKNKNKKLQAYGSAALECFLSVCNTYRQSQNRRLHGAAHDHHGVLLGVEGGEPRREGPAGEQELALHLLDVHARRSQLPLLLPELHHLLPLRLLGHCHLDVFLGEVAYG